ncbi:hypothetical protein [Chryseobacterium taeanense]|uniref:hypothetical protein n=1 Tax=Chryseobacterium taeanense TaxID=311334 RepID=UPI0035AEC158
MKHLFTAAALLLSMTVFAQVGINNTSPKATLDITAKTSGTKPEGLIIPQLAGSDIHTATAAGVYGSNQKGLIIYATSADASPTSATANITTAGYYYFDGTNWQKISTGNTVSTSLASGNIYVGSASNVATAVSPTGDVTISNTGATSIGSGKVTTAHLANNAVTVAKLPAGATATTFLRGDGTWVTPTDTNTTYTGSTSIGLNGTSFERAALTGDVTASANNNSTTIAANAVTTSKIANNAVTVAKLPTGATATTFLRGDGTWVTPTDTNTTYTGSTSIGLNGTSFERAALTGDVTASANSNATTIATNAVTTSKIADNAVTVAKLPTGATATTFLRGDGTWVTPTDNNTTYTSSTSIGLNGTSFERAALTGDVTASANSNATTIAANAVTSAKIADGAVTASKLNQMSATSGQVLGWNGTAWTPTASDTTNDAWVNDTTNGLVKLGTKADGTARAAGADFVVKDNGQIGIGTSTPTTKLEINSSTSGVIKIVDGTQAIGRVLTSDANGLATWTPVGQSASYHDVFSSRSLGTLYTNSTGKEMKIFMTAYKLGGSPYCHLTPVIDGFSMLYQNLDDGRQMQLFYIIPPGATYKFVSETGANFSPAAVSSWYEYY